MVDVLTDSGWDTAQQLVATALGSRMHYSSATATPKYVGIRNRVARVELVGVDYGEVGGRDGRDAEGEQRVCSMSPTTATRLGAAEIVVLPYRCSTVAGKAALEGERVSVSASLPPPRQLATEASSADVTALPKVRRDTTKGRASA